MAKATPARATLADQREVVKILYYGDAGSGKTTAMSSAANLGPVLYIDAESGLKRGPLARLGIPTDQITPHQQITFEALETLYFEVKGLLEDDITAVSAVVLDSVTEIQKILLENIIGKAVTKAAGRGMDRDPFTIDRADWGVVTEQMRRLTRRFRDLPCHVAFGALPKREVDDDGSVTYSPALTPAFQTDLMGYVDVIIHTEVREIGGKEFHVGTCKPVGKYTGKDRFGILPQTLVDPTLDRVVAYVNGELTNDKDPRQLAAREAARTTTNSSE
jgi:hypothetical protein